MANNGLTKSHTAEAAISANRFVKPGAADYGVVTAAAATDKIIGITTEIDAATGERTDVVLEGIADLKLGGTVARGDMLTSDATGQGITATPAAGANVRIGAMAMISGVIGDVIPAKIVQSTLQG
jgi:hypothetical protein